MADPVLADARAYLAGLRGVTILDGFDPREPDCLAVVFASVRYYEVRLLAGGASAAHHLRDGEWLPLAEGTTLNGAYAAIAAHVERIGHLPGWYSAETEAAVRAASAEVLAGAPLSCRGHDTEVCSAGFSGVLLAVQPCSEMICMRSNLRSRATPGMIQLLISNARVCLAWGAAIVVVMAGTAGASIAEAAGASQLVGGVGAATVALVLTAVLFGVTAAILDLHQQMRTLAAAVPRSPAAPLPPSRAASRPARGGSAGPTTDTIPTPPAAPMPGQPPAINPDEPARPAYCDNPDGWRKLMADADGRGWTSWVSFVGIGFKHRETGREVRLASIHKAQAALGL